MSRFHYYKLAKSLVCGLLAILLLGNSVALCGAADTNQRDMVLWYRQPATNWLQAMPLGNGMIGAMVFGGVPARTDRAQRILFLVRPSA